MTAKELRVGESFDIPSCDDTIKNCICLRQSKTATYITAEERKGIKDPWKRIYDYIAPATNVEADPSKPLVEVSRSERGELEVESGAIGKTESSPYERKASNGKRGRKSKSIEFPKGKFTIPELAKKLGCSTTHIYLKITAMLKTGEAKVVGEERAAGQRGRATKYYKVIQ